MNIMSRCFIYLFPLITFACSRRITENSDSALKKIPVLLFDNGSFVRQDVTMNPTDDTELMTRYRGSRKHVDQLTVIKQIKKLRVVERERIELSADCVHRQIEDISLPSNDRQPNRRSKRQSTILHEIELIIILDYPLYLFWLRRNNNDDSFTKAEMVDYYANVVSAANKRYTSVDQNGFAVRLLINAFVIADSAAASPWTQNLNVSGVVQAGSALDDFSVYVQQSGGQIGGIPFDHVALITGFDLASGASTGTAGIAYLSAVCSTFTVSITEELFEELTSVVLAHEIGHSLGSEHDGTNNTCRGRDVFIMAAILRRPSPSQASNPWLFSSCSVTQFRSFLSTSRAVCTRTRQGSPVDITAYVVQQFGQKYPPDLQCEIYVGPGSKFCRSVYFAPFTRRYDSMCYLLFCFRPPTQDCIPISAHDGTSCGDHMWCLTGVCVFSALAPSRPVNCPAGDDPDVNCNLGLCSDSFYNDQVCCDTCKGPAQLSTTPGRNHFSLSIVEQMRNPTQSVLQVQPKPTQSVMPFRPEPTQSVLPFRPEPTQSVMSFRPRPTQSVMAFRIRPTDSAMPFRPRPTQSVMSFLTKITQSVLFIPARATQSVLFRRPFQTQSLLI